ncbi:MAG: glycosyltransferase family 1 protein [Xanthobacteraceae bacterium]|nr:glycosyltransferase family 1 protein [Xanthobacteraceae bacterium]
MEARCKTLAKNAIGLDLDFLSGPRTGVANYTARLIQAVLRAEPTLCYIAFTNFRWNELTGASLQDVVDQPESVEASGRTAATGHTGGLASRAVRLIARDKSARAIYRKARGLLFAALAPTSRLALFHAFNFRPPRDPGVPVLPVIHDLSTFRHPGLHPPDRVQWLDPVARTIARAPMVQTVSQFSKRDIVDLFGYPADRIFVAPPAASSFFMAMGEEPTSRVLAPLGLSYGRFFLTVGSLEPRKNVRTLISAYARLAPSDRARCPLVAVGGKGWGDLNLPSETEALCREGSLRFLDGISNAQLRSLYEGARLLLMPSLYEGFGMPIVEALACGTPVAFSAGTAMEEIAAGHGRTAEAMDAEGWTDILRDALAGHAHCDPGLRQARIARARAFSWQRSAESVLEAYRRLIPQ